MKSIVFYISGHGFGHSSRMAEVINTLLRRDPSLKIIVKTSAPRWFFREQVSSPFRFFRKQYDVGVIQAHSLALDPGETLLNYASFLRRAPTILEEELKFLKRVRPSLIVGDIPPLAFRIAARAGLPSLAVSNFSWDWIYEPYLEKHPRYRGLLASIREDYRQADLLLRLPFSGKMDAFRERRDIPLIARRADLSRARIRKLLKLPAAKPLILLSFGGFRVGPEYYRSLPFHRDLTWLASERVGDEFSGILNLNRERLKKLGLSYPHLVKAADIVITKPGYGIVSECIANRTGMLYTSRGNFREYSYLVRGIKKYLPSRFISQAKLKAGDLREEVEYLLNAPAAFPPISLKGAEAASEIIESYLA